MDIGACQAPPKTAAELEWSCISNLSSPLSFPRISDICHGRVLGPLPPRTVGVKARDGHDAQAKKPPPGRSFRGIDHVRRSTSPRRLYRDLITRDPPDRSLKLSTADRRTQRSGKQFSSMASRRACMDMDVRRKKASTAGGKIGNKDVGGDRHVRSGSRARHPHGPQAQSMSPPRTRFASRMPTAAPFDSTANQHLRRHERRHLGNDWTMKHYLIFFSCPHTVFCPWSKSRSSYCMVGSSGAVSKQVVSRRQMQKKEMWEIASTTD
ncbi:hypothetical protein GW17_00023284 [Ensete ventricosum]|nr:hypothetical protein GW17_00023284 [Ensete ventricosum]RZR96406.1 hypothetical protein BHM03_00025422 [Ensete ventricosum]